jgi:hypothetical protein
VWLVSSWGIFYVLFPAQCQSYSFVDGRFSAGLVVELVLEVWMHFRLSFSLADHSVDVAALFQIHEN